METHTIELPMCSRHGLDVFRWPEWAAFAERLGIPENLRTVAVTVRIAVGEVVSIKHEFQGADLKQGTERIETTCAHNRNFVTFAVSSDDPITTKE